MHTDFQAVSPSWLCEALPPWPSPWLPTFVASLGSSIEPPPSSSSSCSLGLDVLPFPAQPATIVLFEPVGVCAVGFWENNYHLSISLKKKEALKKIPFGGMWVAQLVKCLPLAQVMIMGS